jgi:hypothetical protein
MTMGRTIFEWSPRSAAAGEIDNLTNEILSHVQEDVRNSSEAQTAHG